MKQLMVLLVCMAGLSMITGCQNTGSGVEVIIEDDGQFPRFLVGRWKADRGGWEFVFEPDGAISSAVHTIGRVKMKPGQITTVPMKRGGKGIFEQGDWSVYYAPTSRELTLKISLKNFYVELGEDVLEGKSTDVFVGQISQDGKFWQAEWTGFPEYKAHTSEYPNFDLSADPDYGVSKVLIFEKVTP